MSLGIFRGMEFFLERAAGPTTSPIGLKCDTDNKMLIQYQYNIEFLINFHDEVVDISI